MKNESPFLNFAELFSLRCVWDTDWILISACRLERFEILNLQQQDMGNGEGRIWARPYPLRPNHFLHRGQGSVGAGVPFSWPCLGRCRGCLWLLRRWCFHEGATSCEGFSCWSLSCLHWSHPYGASHQRTPGERQKGYGDVKMWQFPIKTKEQ